MCSIAGCEKPVYSKGWCKMHFRRWQRHGNPHVRLYEVAAGKTCSIFECGRPVESHGLCAMHAKRKRRNGDPLIVKAERQIGKCRVEGCLKPAKSKSYCFSHYATVFKYDRDHLILANDGEGTIDKNGYREFNIQGRKVKEHIWLAEQALGRRLPAGAVVHHMNGDKLDNHTPLNLVICPDQAYHMLLHKRMRAAARPKIAEQDLWPDTRRRSAQGKERLL